MKEDHRLFIRFLKALSGDRTTALQQPFSYLLLRLPPAPPVGWVFLSVQIAAFFKTYFVKPPASRF